MERQVILNSTHFELTIDRLCYQLIESHNNFENTVLIGLQPRGVNVLTRLKSTLEKILGVEVVCGNLDVELEDGINDTEYLKLLEASLIKVKNQFNPDFVFFQSGVDILSTDKLGRLGLSLQGCRRRDQMVAEFTHDLGLPIVCTMGGGYSRDIRDIVNAHANTFEIIATYFG